MNGREEVSLKGYLHLDKEKKLLDLVKGSRPLRPKGEADDEVMVCC